MKRLIIIVLAACLSPVARIHAVDNIDAGMSNTRNVTAGSVDGTVGLSIPLLQIGSGKAIYDVVLNYSSNVHNTVSRSNSEAQSAWVGLGWYYNPSSIRADYGGTYGNESDDIFYFTSESGASYKFAKASSSDYFFEKYKYWNTLPIISDNVIIGWKITKEDGVVYEYGNVNPGGDPVYNANCMMYYTNGNWIGPASDLAGVVPYKWYISAIEDLDGNRIEFQYDQKTEAINGFAERYTRAIYPDRITDICTGRVMCFIKHNRDDDGESVPTVVPGKYNIFEVSYLDRIQLWSSDPGGTDAVMLNRIDFEYQVNNALQDKRLLDALIVENHVGTVTHTESFKYSDPDMNNPGALVRWSGTDHPTYEYEYNDLYFKKRQIGRYPYFTTESLRKAATTIFVNNFQILEMNEPDPGEDDPLPVICSYSGGSWNVEQEINIGYTPDYFIPHEYGFYAVQYSYEQYFGKVGVHIDDLSKNASSGLWEMSSVGGYQGDPMLKMYSGKDMFVFVIRECVNWGGSNYFNPMMYHIGGTPDNAENLNSELYKDQIYIKLKRDDGTWTDISLVENGQDYFCNGYAYYQFIEDLPQVVVNDSNIIVSYQRFNTDESLISYWGGSVVLYDGGDYRDPTCIGKTYTYEIDRISGSLIESSCEVINEEEGRGIGSSEYPVTRIEPHLTWGMSVRDYGWGESEGECSLFKEIFPLSDADPSERNCISVMPEYLLISDYYNVNCSRIPAGTKLYYENAYLKLPEQNDFSHVPIGGGGDTYDAGQLYDKRKQSVIDMINAGRKYTVITDDDGTFFCNHSRGNNFDFTDNLPQKITSMMRFGDIFIAQPDCRVYIVPEGEQCELVWSDNMTVFNMPHFDPIYGMSSSEYSNNVVRGFDVNPETGEFDYTDAVFDQNIKADNNFLFNRYAIVVPGRKSLVFKDGRTDYSGIQLQEIQDVAHYTLKKKEIINGSNVRTVKYKYDEEVADESYNVVYYGKVTVYEYNGKTEHFYHTDEELRGRVYLTKNYDNSYETEPYFTATNSFRVVDMMEPGFSFLPIFPLQAQLVIHDAATSDDEGMLSTITMEYNPDNGMISRLVKDEGTDNEEEVQILYAFEASANATEFAAKHFLSAVYEKQSTSSTGTILNRHRTEWDEDCRKQSEIEYVSDQERTVWYDQYSMQGMLQEAHAANGLHTATKYGYNGLVPIATFLNAEFAECSYTGFENGSSDEWGISAAQISDEASFTGTASFKSVNGNITYIIIPVASLDAETDYHVTAQFLVEAGEPRLEAAGIDYVSVDTDADGWVKGELVIPASALNGLTNLQIICGFAAGVEDGVCYIDDVCFKPVDSYMKTYTYDMTFQRVTSEMTEGYQAVEYLYDENGELSGALDAHGAVVTNIETYRK